MYVKTKPEYLGREAPSSEVVMKAKELPDDVKVSLEETKGINHGLSCFSWTGKHKLDPKNTPKENLKILDHMCGFRNVLCPSDKNDEVAPSAYLDIAVSEDKDQREIFKKDQQQVLMQSIISRLGQKNGMRLGKRRLTALGIIKSQSLILNGDHLESMRKEAELMRSVEEISDKQREEDREKKEKELRELHAIADDALKKLVDNNGDATKKAVTKKHICAILLKCCNISFKNYNNESKASLVDKLNIEKAKGTIPGFAMAAPTFPDVLLPPAFPDLSDEQNKKEETAGTGEI
jgi:hypothetical protein